MPPKKFGKALTEAEVAVLSKWISQGAHYAKHWSYVKPVKSPLPAVDPRFAQWPHNEIDRFALARMIEHGLQPSAAADREALARRLYLDLIGLPPSVEVVDAFVADQRPDAYERLVDEVLANPAFGEHWLGSGSTSLAMQTPLAMQTIHHERSGHTVTG